jgi:uracil-DNA glycosylase
VPESDRRPLILGEAPSKSGDRYWQFPLSGAVGERLCTWAGLEPEPGGTRYGRFYWPLREAYELRNLIERWPGAQGNGAAFPMPAARAAWAELLPELEGRHVVLLGARLAEVAELGLSKPISRWGSWLSRPWCAAVAVIPHPSGLNRLYSEASTREAASECLRTARMLAGPVPR